MKILLYLENRKGLSNSGIGRALSHQMKALESQGIEYTLDPSDTYDLAHINSNAQKSYSLLKKCKRNNIPVIAHGHSTHEDFKESFRCWQLMAPFYNHMMNRMYTKADLIITPTEYSKKLIENYKNVNCPVEAVSNGIVLSLYEKNEENIKNFENMFNIEKNDKVIIGVGFYFKRKGIDDFMEIARHHRDVKFIWFGYLNKLLTTSYCLKVIKNKPDNVILPGYIKGDIMNGALHRASAMLFPTREETEGIVVLEAFASHLPLITRDIGVYQDWLTKDNSYKCRSIDDFDKAVDNIFTKDQTSLTSNAYKVAEERSIEKVGERLKQIYSSLLSK